MSACRNCSVWPAAGFGLCHTCLAPHPGRSDDEVAKREMARAADMDLRVALSVLAERTAELEALKARRCDGCAYFNPFVDGHGPNGVCVAFEFEAHPEHACNAWRQP